MDAESLRDAYVERFGALYEALEIGAAVQPSYHVLSFWDAEVPASPVVYATFGAHSRWELVVVAAAPLSGLVGALMTVGLMDPEGLSPYQLLEVDVERTPFAGLLVAPPEDGSFVVEETDGGRREVYRLIPITQGERAMAAELGPREVYRRVRAADALVADPLRDCTVTPQRTALWRMTEGPVLMRDLGEQLDATELRLERLRARPERGAQPASFERAAPQIRAYLRHLASGLPFPPALGAWVVAPGTPLEKRLARLAEVLVKRSVEHWTVFVPEELCAALAEMASLTILTHPEALRLVETLLGENVLPPATEGSNAVARECSWRIATFDGRARRVSGRVEVERRVCEGFVGAAARRAPEDEIPYENHVWACMVEALYEGGVDGRAVAAALQEGIDRSRRLEPDPSTAPPLPRLMEMLHAVTVAMFVGYCAARGRAQEN